MTNIELRCYRCEKVFIRSLGRHNGRIKDGFKKWFCSNECDLAYRDEQKVPIPCGFCGKMIRRTDMVHQIATSKSGHIFCNHSCAVSYSNARREKTRRSKMEIKLFDLLTAQYPKLEILPNDKTMLNGLEVDIAIPSLKLAIEWNGIVHFKPIYGQKKLDRIQSIDKHKTILANSLEINLIVISDLVSTDARVQEAFASVCQIIDNLLS